MKNPAFEGFWECLELHQWCRCHQNEGLKGHVLSFTKNGSHLCTAHRFHYLQRSRADMDMPCSRRSWTQKELEFFGVIGICMNKCEPFRFGVKKWPKRLLICYLAWGKYFRVLIQESLWWKNDWIPTGLKWLPRWISYTSYEKIRLLELRGLSVQRKGQLP